MISLALIRAIFENANQIDRRSVKIFRDQKPGASVGVVWPSRQEFGSWTQGRLLELQPCELTMIRSPQLPQIDLARHMFDLPLVVDMEAFFDFSFWIAEELLDLEAKYGKKHSGRMTGQGEKETVV